MSKFITPGSILAYFEARPHLSATAKVITRELGLKKTEKTEIQKLLKSLVRSGELRSVSGKRFVSAKQGKLYQGIVRRHLKGFGWLEVQDSDLKDVFIPPPELVGLMDGDLVACRIEDHPKGPVASIDHVVTRARKTIVGVYCRRGRGEFVEPESNVLGESLQITADSRTEEKLADGMVVEVEIINYPDRFKRAQGRVLRVIGRKGDFASEVEMLIVEGGIEQSFSQKTDGEAEAFGDIPRAEDVKGRLDLKQLALCTIDGETAKDFDDAVYAEKQGEEFAVTVAIADVSHYVQRGTAIDADAFARGTSVYYPGHCIPMLPEVLSNGLCSLKPNIPRLCMVVQMLVTKRGAMKRVRIEDAVMQSQARLTYTRVQKFLDGDDPKDIPAPVQESLRVLKEASSALRRARKARGAIDFDTEESLIALSDSGEPIAIHPEERLEAHRMIEDLMVATNEAVAQFLEKQGWPAVFRVHESPEEEKLKNFFLLSESLGAITPAQKRAFEKEKGPKALAKLMEHIENHPAKVALNTLLLRSMMQAKYSADNIGHFGLASESYLHFTSPIRRYPDLVVHRLVRQCVKQKRKKLSDDEKEQLLSELGDIALHCSQRERKAVDVERQIAQLHSAWLMRDKVGEQDAGIITGCTEFGMFVRLTKYHVEGLVHVATLGAGQVEFDAHRLLLREKNSGRTFSIGDQVQVKVVSVNVARRRIDLELLNDKKAKNARRHR